MSLGLIMYSEWSAISHSLARYGYKSLEDSNYRPRVAELDDRETHNYVYSSFELMVLYWRAWTIDRGWLIPMTNISHMKL